MRPGSIRLVAALATLVAVLSCSGADDIPGPRATGRKSDSTLFAGLSASGPVANAFVASDRNAGEARAAMSAQVSYVSLVPGTFSDGTTATVTNLRTAERLTVEMLDGGFDPQPIPASLNDTLQVTVSLTGGKPDVVAYIAVARPAPRIVRTRPPRGQTDVPLNTVIAIVFTEPVNPASVNTTSVTLSAGASLVPGEVHVVVGTGYTVEFTPSTLLGAFTTYTLTVSAAVTNTAGSSMGTPASITFKTAGSASGAVMWMTVSPDSATANAGSHVQLEARLKDSFGGIAIPPYESVIWKSSAPDVAYVNYAGSVTAIGAGTAVISVRSTDARYPSAATARITVNPATTPEGAIVFTFCDFDSGPCGLYAVDPDGSNGRMLTGDSELDPVWSPDGTSIAFRSGRGCNWATSTCHFDLYVMKADGSGVRGDGSGLRRLTTFSGLDVRGMSWSPDGSRIVFAGAVLPTNLSSREALYVVNADGSGLRLLVSGPPGTSASSPEWSPDGSRIAYNVVLGDTSAINIVHADGSNDIRISRPSASRGDLRPRWSPDGKRIAFMRSWLDKAVDYGVQSQVFVMDADGSNVMPITPVSPEDSYPVWSPDGTRLALISQQRLDIVNADGRGQATIYTMFCCAEPGISWRRAPSTASSVTTQVRVQP